jgi:hypothetical protein
MGLLDNALRVVLPLALPVVSGLLGHIKSVFLGRIRSQAAMVSSATLLSSFKALILSYSSSIARDGAVTDSLLLALSSQITGVRHSMWDHFGTVGFLGSFGFVVVCFGAGGGLMLPG